MAARHFASVEGFAPEVSEASVMRWAMDADHALNIELLGVVPQYLFDNMSLPTSVEVLEGRYLITEQLPYAQTKSTRSRIFTCTPDGSDANVIYESEFWTRCHASPDKSRFMSFTADMPSLLQGKRDEARNAPGNRVAVFDIDGNISFSSDGEMLHERFPIAGNWFGLDKLALMDCDGKSMWLTDLEGNWEQKHYCGSSPAMGKWCEHGFISATRAVGNIHRLVSRDALSSVYLHDGTNMKKLFTTHFTEVGLTNLNSMDVLKSFVFIATSMGISVFDFNGRQKSSFCYADLNLFFGTEDRTVMSFRKSLDGKVLHVLTRGEKESYLYAISIQPTPGAK